MLEKDPTKRTNIVQVLQHPLLFQRIFSLAKSQNYDNDLIVDEEMKIEVD